MPDLVGYKTIVSYLTRYFNEHNEKQGNVN